MLSDEQAWINWEKVICIFTLPSERGRNEEGRRLTIVRIARKENRGDRPEGRGEVRLRFSVDFLYHVCCCCWDCIKNEMVLDTCIVLELPTVRCS